MDGNVKRVFSRYFGIYGDTSRRVVEQALWERAQAAIAAAPDSLDMSRYTQGLMDLGSTRCVRGRPECARCPLSSSCYARVHSVQTELPTRRVKKDVPQRQCKMLILQRQDSVLLERQPSPGIWGGLWSLPQYEDAAALDIAISHHAGPMPKAQKLAALLHTFTHFKLHIEPWYVQCDAGLIAEPASTGQQWIPVTGLRATALPAPVKTLLEGLFSSESAGIY
jgi:A/G-specific adenine glycosylase